MSDHAKLVGLFEYVSVINCFLKDRNQLNGSDAARITIIDSNIEHLGYERHIARKVDHSA